MSLRTWFRDWLNAPSASEVADAKARRERVLEWIRANPWPRLDLTGADPLPAWPVPPRDSAASFEKSLRAQAQNPRSPEARWRVRKGRLVTLLRGSKSVLARPLGRR